MRKVNEFKYTFYGIIFLMISGYQSPCFSQGGTWVWMKGDNTYNSLGNYGTQGVPALTNNPRAIYEPCQWTDLNGNFWIFGGGFGGSSFYSDLWKFDVATNLWTWMIGPGTPDQYGVYGVKGVSSSLNHPGARGLAAGTWTDQNNNLWLFGGTGKDGVAGSFTNDLNDLWMYNTSTNEWTWTSGDSVSGSFGNYGVQGVSSPLNVPSARHETNCTWLDNNGRLWLYGGYCISPPFLSDSQNDLWMYDPAINEWTWVNGSSIVSVPAVYGIKGVPSAANTPGARCTYARWKDNSGNLWLFGGWNSASQYTFNDLWKYDISSGMWTWVDGSIVHHDPGQYSSFCNNDTNDFPSARYENRSSWTDHCGNFWFYGGSHENVINSVLGDMWVYNPTTQVWKWVFGDTALNRSTQYGIQGVANPADDPGGRMGAVSFLDAAGNLWMFGGLEIYGGSNTHNDLWKFIADSSCIDIFCNSAQPSVGFYSSDTTWCDKKAIDFFDVSTNNPDSWHWYFQGAVPDTSSLQNPTGIYYPAFGSFDVKLVACNGVFCDSLVMISFVKEIQPPPQPIITYSNDTFYSTPAFAYQWYDQNGLINGATQDFYVTQQPGTYFVVISDSLGCNTSSGSILINSVNEAHQNNYAIKLFPNPASRESILFCTNYSASEIIIRIIDLAGRELKQIVKNNLQPGRQEIKIDVKSLVQGIYICKINIDHREFYARLMVE